MPVSTTLIRCSALALTLAVAGLAPSTAAADPDEVLGVVGETKITRGEIEEVVAPQLAELDQQRFDILTAGLNEMIAKTTLELEAKSQGIDVEELLKKEVEAKTEGPSDADVEQLFEANKSQFQGETLETLGPKIRDYLTAQSQGARQQEYIGELRKKYGATVKLDPPRMEVASGGRAAKGGGEDAPITIIAFSDYECPFCRRAEKTVDEVLEKYGDKVRYIHRDYPLPFHPDARVAAQAALCAEEQGKFWEFHKLLFEDDSLKKKTFYKHAEKLELDGDAFKECLKSERTDKQVDKDMEDGSAVGVNGTPAYFVNGRALSGALPFSEFESVIEDELARFADTDD